ncbi:MAG: hypothetical protein ACM359_09275 [Bacillota bacterium]
MVWARMKTIVAIVGAALLTGCASNTPPQSTLTPTTQGVTCTKCQVTWVKIPETNQKGRIVGYTWGKRDVCPDCMDAVQSFFNTGKFQHTCKTCGDALQICESH